MSNNSIGNRSSSNWNANPMSEAKPNWKSNGLYDSTGVGGSTSTQESSSKGGVKQTTTLNSRTVALKDTADPPSRSTSRGEKIKNALASMFHSVTSLIGRLSTSREANVPISAPADNSGRTVAELKGRFEYQALTSSGALDVRSSNLTKDHLSAASYAFVKQSADEIKGDSEKVEKFIRENNVCSKTTAVIGEKSAELTSMSKDIRSLIGNDPIILNRDSIGRLPGEDTDVHMKPKHPAVAKMWDETKADGGLDRQALAKSSVDKVDQVMCHVFGTPGDQNSIKQAADRLPQSLCDQLALMHKAIDNSNNDDTTKDRLKLQCGRDALVLRAINPALVARPEINATDSPEMKQSVMSVSKGMQNLVNGMGIVSDKDGAKEVATVGAHMKSRWEDGFSDFMAAVAARGNTTTVNNAAADGGMMLETFDRIKGQIATTTQPATQNPQAVLV